MTGLYLHIPFCHSKCPYCDFFSLCGDEAALAEYVELLGCELHQQAQRWEGPFDTLFFGGGTPSRLTPGQVDTLLQNVRRTFGISEIAEITLEANPGTVNGDSLSGYLQAGINRLSFGVQSFDDRFLGALGRRHSAEQARAAFFAARHAGFDNLSLDLIFALPGQNENDLDREIDTLIELGPEHISTYCLTLEEGTPLYHRHQREPLPLPDDEQAAAFYELLHQRLTAAGYQHYEISNYARPGRECRHNQATWRRQPYLGVGTGAHSFIAEGWGERRAVLADLDHYRDALQQRHDPSHRLETFDRAAAMQETVYLALRTAEGLNEIAFRERFGVAFDVQFHTAIARCGEHLVHDAGQWFLTLDGWLLYDHLIQHFFA